MSWLEALRPVAGPLLDSARTWLRAAGHDAPDSSVDAVRLLVAAIDDVAFQDDSPEADQADERLVEGGGALLGLALLDRHGGRHDRRGRAHRVLLGRHGTFDPLRAIHRALDPDEPAAELRTAPGLSEHCRVRAPPPTSAKASANCNPYISGCRRA